MLTNLHLPKTKVSKIRCKFDLDILVLKVRSQPAEPVLYAERILPLVDSLLVAGAVCLVSVASPVDSADAVARVATEPVMWKRVHLVSQLG